MTEEEAKLKQCCGPEPCGFFNDNPYPARWCIASACMAWRSRNQRHNAFSRVSEGIDGTTDGYCGLSGKP
ncbi:MAG: hypothetical protein KGL39_51965 [Patescibacteria group bacterium]|nr:hypothetical protein [Patescibacteria group bacterium]